MPSNYNQESLPYIRSQARLASEADLGTQSIRQIQGPFIISNCHRVDVVHGTVDTTPHSILISNGRIANISVTSPLPGVPVYDAHAGFIVPGLIDMHVHVTLDPHLRLDSDPLKETEPQRLRHNSLLNVEKALDSGITTMRDLGGRLRMPQIIRNQIEKGDFPGPRLVVAGEMITCRNGHGTEEHFQFGAECETLEDVRAAVQRNCVEGADWIKITTQGGPHPEEFSVEYLKAAVASAHAEQRRIACHAHFQESSIAKAIDARVDTVEHGCVLTRDLATQMAEFDVAYCPTLEIVARLAEEPALFGVESESFIQKIREIREKHIESVNFAMDAGVKIVAGTDAGIGHLEFDGIHRELYRLEQAGLTRKDALRAATVTAGTVLAMPGITGTLAPGSTADFLITATNPLVDLTTLRKPLAVFIDGRMVRGSLEEAGCRIRVIDPSRVN